MANKIFVQTNRDLMYRPANGGPSTELAFRVGKKYRLVKIMPIGILVKDESNRTCSVTENGTNWLQYFTYYER